MSNLEQEISFFTGLAKLCANSSASRATLRRSLSNESKHKFERYSILLPRLPRDLPIYRRDTWILCACLFAQYPQEAIVNEGTSFGETCRELEDNTTSGGVDRRFRLLLSQESDNLKEPLTHLFRWAAKKKAVVDYPTLLNDLCLWGHPAQFVQERWASDFWGHSK